MECAQCGAPLYIPEWSEYLDTHRARHLWRCEKCDYNFETTVQFAAA
jgi:primosomal protein N'